MQKRDNWFLDYQDTTYGAKGQRVLENRTPFFDKNDFIDKTVLDVGCNLGQMCDYASVCGANKVIGIEYDKTVVDIAKKNNKKNNVTYICDDIDNYFLYTNIDDKIDTVLLLSVIETQELTNKMGMLSKFAKLCNVLYLEGHVNSKYENIVKYLTNYTDFTQIEFKGLQYDNSDLKEKNLGRHIFRCSRDSHSFETSLNCILRLLKESSINHKIAVSGKGGAGKTTLRRSLLLFLNNNGFDFDTSDINKENNVLFIDDKNKVVIIDDIEGKQCEHFWKNHEYKVIYFDYRSIEYMSSYTTTVFYIKSNAKTFENRPYEYSLLRSPTDILYNVLNIYHIQSYLQ